MPTSGTACAERTASHIPLYHFQIAIERMNSASLPHLTLIVTSFSKNAAPYNSTVLNPSRSFPYFLLSICWMALSASLSIACLQQAKSRDHACKHEQKQRAEHKGRATADFAPGESGVNLCGFGGGRLVDVCPMLVLPVLVHTRYFLRRIVLC